MIPTEAVIPEAKGSKVYVVKNGKSISTKVTLGTRSDKTVEIIDGLAIGDTLITNGIIQVKPDGEVEIKEVVK
jgi:membrane fusion protein (multidrug efflux system)